MGSQPTTSVVVLAHGAEPHLGDCVGALVASEPIPEIIVVDNGASAAVGALPRCPHVKIISAGRNLGFAGGCDFGASAAAGAILVFVNSDAIVAPGAVSEIAKAVRDPAIGVASGSIRLAAEPELLNSRGNPVHFLGFSWVGCYREPAASHAERADVASFSGATFGLRRAVWQELGGFDPEYFAYGEDVDLSIRAWQRGYRVIYVPEAISFHRYEFSRNRQKMYLLERNRLATVLATHEFGTLVRLAPLAVLVEAAVLAAAVRAGWGWQKLRSWGWIAKHPRWLLARRRRVQEARTKSDAEILGIFQATIEIPAGLGTPIPPLVNRFLAWYWRLMSRGMIRRSGLACRPGHEPPSGVAAGREHPERAEARASRLT